MKTNIALSLAVGMLLGGCSMAPELEVKNPELPKNMHTSSEKIDKQWWRGFNDPTLNRVIDDALEQSDDLKLAMANVSLAKATLGLANAERYPDITGSADAYRQRTSAESLSPFSGVTYNNFGLSSTIGYEFDFWGKFANAEKGAWSRLLASEADKETARISLVSGVAELYIQQIALKQKMTLLEEMVKAYKESYEYRKREFRHGQINELVVGQSHALYANAQVTLASLKKAAALNENALALTIGYAPKQQFEGQIDVPLQLPEVQKVPAGIGSELLQRRPDILAAEERLRAANADIGVVKANYFPSISLTSTAGLQSIELDKLLTSSAKTWGVGPSLNLPLLDFGRVKRSVQRTEAEKEIAMITYTKTVKKAFTEVYDALAQIKHSQVQIAAQNREVKALKQVLELSEKQFKSGYGIYLDLLTAKRELLSTRIAMIDLNAELIVNQIVLFKALGGGWKRTQRLP
ncbi:efflux transporter outer membrane subunit [Sulfurovum sp. TSL1]|uniref:efflux transporter outer membrane subunit n=1 Tax=Sulfurovum sp. TSL1 TaxID=2826994 RepID=UPI001CC4AD26|nr:efflux transporter outer membrane subunit [Sulfurovum sp. TSL1]GIT97305.1 RND transporter [Sulfurovum sp. TSL1]